MADLFQSYNQQADILEHQFWFGLPKYSLKVESPDRALEFSI